MGGEKVINCVKIVLMRVHQMKWIAVLLVVVLTVAFCSVGAEGGEPIKMEFREMLRDRIVEILKTWTVKDQYAIMFFIYPNECNEYGGYTNIPEFTMLYKCESDLPSQYEPSSGAFDSDEERWNPAFWWGLNEEEYVIAFNENNPIADALIDWYRSGGVQDIGTVDTEHNYDSGMRYVGKGPKGLPELLELVTEIALELQTDGTMEARFGKKIPIILADFEFTWYMVAATVKANPHGEADEYIETCLREGWVYEDQIR